MSLEGPVGLAVVEQLRFVLLDNEAWGAGLDRRDGQGVPAGGMHVGAMGTIEGVERPGNEPPVFRTRSALSAKVRGDRAQALRGPRVPRPAAGERHGLVAAGVEIRTAQALLGGSNAQLTLGLYAQAVVSLGAAAVDSMAERFGLPARDGRAMERCEEGSEGQDDGET